MGQGAWLEAHELMGLLDEIRASQRQDNTSPQLSLLDAIRADAKGAPDSPTLRNIISTPAPRSMAEARARDEADLKIADNNKDEGFLDRAGGLVSRWSDSFMSGANRVASAVQEFNANTPLPWTSDENIARERGEAGLRRGLAREQERAAAASVAGEQTVSDFIANPSLGKLPQLVADLGIQSVPGMAAALANPVATAASLTGNLAQRRAENNGNADATLRDVAISAPAGAVSTALDRFGVENIIGAAGRNAAVRIGKAEAGEGVTEGVQSGIEYAGGNAGTDAGFDWKEAGRQMGEGALGGVLLGGALRGTGEAGHGGVRAFRDRPVAPGVREVAAATTDINAGDVDSPIDTDLIAAGKQAIASAAATPEADRILAGAGMPRTGRRVTVTMPDGREMSGTVADAFDTDAGDLGPASGIRVNLDDGSTFSEHFDTIRETGVKIAEATPLAEADAIDAALQRQAELPLAAPATSSPTPATSSEPPSRPSGPKGKPVADGGAVVRELFPDAHVTSTSRSKDDPLSKANPRSWHANSNAAVDVRPIKGVTFDQFVQGIRDKGYSIIEAKNELGAARSAWATGDHWHVVIGESGGTSAAPVQQAAASPKLADEIRAEQAPENQGVAVRGAQIDEEWHRFAPETGTLDVPRAEMPQVAAEHRGALVNFLAARGIDHTEETVPADTLKPTQSEFSTRKVARAKAFTGGDRAILVSSDNYVVDGHHQWVGKRDVGEDVRIIRLNAPIRELLDVVPQMPSATTDGGAGAEPSRSPVVQSSELPVHVSPPAIEPAARPSLPNPPDQLEQQGSAPREIVGDPPSSGVAPANIGADGKVYVDARGSSHFAVAEKYPDVRFEGETGFVNPNGEYLDRAQALAWVNANGENVRPSPNMTGQLDALDYRDQVGKTQARPVSERNGRRAPPIDVRAAITAAPMPRGYKLVERDGNVVFQSANGSVGDGGDVTIGPVDTITQAQIDKAVQDARDDAEILLPSERSALEAYRPANRTETRLRDKILRDGRTDGSDAHEDFLMRSAYAPDPALPSPSREGRNADAEKDAVPAASAPASEQASSSLAEAAGNATPEPATQPEGTQPLFDEEGEQIGWWNEGTGGITLLDDAAKAVRAQPDLSPPQVPAEARNSIPDDPVAVLTGNELGVEFRGDEDFHNLIVAAKRWYRKNLVGRTITMFDGVPVTFSARGLRESVAHKGDVLLRIIPAIPDILQKGYRGSTLPGDRADISRIVWVNGKVDFMGQEITVAVAVREHSDGTHRQYTLTNVDWLHESAGGRSFRIVGTASETLGIPDKQAPPAEINIRLIEGDAKTIAAPEGSSSDWSEVQARMVDRVRALGMGDRLTVNVVDAIEGRRDVAGRYWRGVIDVAMATSQDAETTLNHEVVHAMRDMGLFLPAEWKSLEAAARADKAMMGSIRKRYPGLSEDAQIEEAVADRYARWAKGRGERGFVAKAFERVSDFLRAIGQVLRGAGFTTADGVMRAMDQGSIGRRFGSSEPESSVRYSIPHILGRDASTDNADAHASISNLIEAARSSGPMRAKLDDALETWRIRLQDRMLPVLRVQERAAEQTGREIAEEANPYLSEELMSGRIGAKLERLTSDIIEPLFEAMHAEKVSISELETYLYARHAPERNARIAQINPEFGPGEGSGMTDAEARSIMTEVDQSGKRPVLEALAAQVDRMLADALQTRVDGGLMSQADAQAWRAQYSRYVPLRGKAEIDTDVNLPAPRVSKQSGISVRGKESSRAFGRTSKANDILAYAILQAQEAITRAETNRAARAFYELAQSAPDPDFWKVDKIERRAVWNKSKQQVEYQSQSRISAEDAPYTVSLKIDGQEHRVTMGRTNPAAVAVADAMRNLTATKAEWLVKNVGRFTRAFSQINTRFSPPFIITNAIRDVITASVVLEQHNIPGMTRAVLGDWLSALRADGNARSEWGKWRREWELAGGKVFFNQTGDLNQIKREIDGSIKQLQRPGALAGAWSKFFKGVDLLNDAVERAVRLSVYKNARTVGGMSQAQSASMARNITVNFTRRGSWGSAINSGFAFFNASVQGTATLALAAVRSKKVRRTMAAIVVAGFLADMLNGLLSEDDEDGQPFWDKVPDHEKSRNAIIMVPGGGGASIKLPLAYGINALFGLGRNISATMRGKLEPQKAAIASALDFSDAFNPMGGGGSWLNIIAPTIFDPAVDLWGNRDFTGKPIQPEPSPFEPPVPPSNNYFPSVSKAAKALTGSLNSVTGGDAVRPGWASYSPETVEYLAGYFSGGAGRFVGDAVGLFSNFADPEHEGSVQEWPVIKAVVGAKSPWVDKATFYDRTKQVQQQLEYAKDYAERGDQAGVTSLVEEQRAVLEMAPLTKAAKKEMSIVRKERGRSQLAYDLGRIDAATYADDLKILKAAEDGIVSAYNARWNRAVLKSGDDLE